MGVRGLFSFIKPYSKLVTHKSLLSGPIMRIGIDISNYIYRWQGDPLKVLEFLNPLMKYGHKCVLIFDGRAADSKADESLRRKTVRDEELEHANKLKAMLVDGIYTEEQKAQ